MAPKIDLGRRSLLRGASALAASRLLAAAPLAASTAAPRGRLGQSVSRWCFDSISLDELARRAVRIGYRGIDLLGPDDFATIWRHGLVCPLVAVGGVVTIEKGLNRIENHPALVAALHRAIDVTAEAGFPNVVCFSGNRAGLSDEEGLANCARGLGRLLGHAEQKGVTLCMELLNSKIDHPDYMCDHTAWGLALVRRVGSPRFKLLYDVYHMQIMEGDLIRTIRRAIHAIGHFHLAGVPGRHEIDDSQELNYGAICRAIADTGYRGFVAQEFVPRGDPLRALQDAFRICEV